MMGPAMPVLFYKYEKRFVSVELFYLISGQEGGLNNVDFVLM